MQYQNIALLQLLAEEYAELSNHSSTAIKQKTLSELEGDIGVYDIDPDDDFDEIETMRNRVEEEILVLLTVTSRKRLSDSNDRMKQKKSRPSKYASRRLKFIDPNTMERKPFTFEYSMWYHNYVLFPQPECRHWDNLFRKRFQMPYNAFLDLVAECKESSYLKQWDGSNSVHPYNGSKRIPIELLVLTSLRYLGRGWTMDDLQENTAISQETIRTFIIKFIEFGSNDLFNKYVKSPDNIAELSNNAREYTSAGFPGCIGSCDASHIVIERCEYRLRQLHLGYKLSHTARTYNMTVNHKQRILHTTFGHPSRFNDKTLVLFDTLILKLKNGKYNDIYNFELMDEDKDGNVVKVKYNGCYVIVDNGYLSWSITVPPLKNNTSRSEIRFSQWLESLRKDVECTFGILKCRWKILKFGVRFHTLEKCDQTWKTCCALHNMLLDKDGLSETWDRGIRTYYEDSEDSLETPFAIQKLLDPNLAMRYDISGNGRGNDYIKNNHDMEGKYIECEQQKNNDDSYNINDLSLDEFRKRLIRHFNIAFSKNVIVWPKR